MTADRNRLILEDVLDGRSFVKVAAGLRLHPVTVRAAFLREVRKTAPELWEEAKEDGYATPSLAWLRRNKDKVIAEPALRTKKKLDAEVSAAILLLEACGYTVTPNVQGEPHSAARTEQR